MKKSIHLLFLSVSFMGLFSSLYGQRIDKNEIRLTYVQLPLIPLPREIQTYSTRIDPGEVSFKFIHLKNQTMRNIIQVEAGSNSNYGSVKESETDFLVLPGYKRIPQSGDLKIDVTFKKLSVNNKVTKTGTGEFSENNTMVSRTMYFYEFDYSYFAGVTMTTKANDTLMKKVFKNANHVKARYGNCGDCKSAGDGPTEPYGASYTSPAELETSFQERFLSEQESKWTRDPLLEIKEYLYTQRGKPLMYTDFTIIGGKGKFNYSDLDTAIVKMKKAASILSAKNDSSSAVTLINEAVTIWKKALDEFEPANMKARINDEIAAGLQYNTGLAYAWLNKFDLCREWMTKASSVKDGLRLVKDIQWWIDNQEKRFKANNQI